MSERPGREARSFVFGCTPAKEDTIVQKDDLLVPAVSVGAERKNEKRTATLNKMFSKMDLDNRDRSLYWKKPFEGEVTKVEKRPTEIRVFIKSKEPFKEGDKRR